MSQTPEQIGPYRIDREIGRGGMGVVYRAQDTKLGRDVALKVLPEEVSSDPKRVARFREEARILATLNHPNILTIHDVDTDADLAYVVTELLEGDTLGEILQRERLSWNRASEIGAGIAEGLAAAHARGVVHRDLKPDNVFVTGDGVVKILDFGLARTSDDRCGPEETRTHATIPGTVLGTIGYMAPEQVRGETADARADIFAFGCVLYEMLTGRRAFQRDTPAESMTAILREPAQPPRESVVDLPVEMERVLSRCLEKDTGQRFQSARDLAFSLRGVSGAPGTSPSGPQIPPPSPKGRGLWIFGAVAGLLVVAAFVWKVLLPEQAHLKPIDSVVVLPFSVPPNSTDDAFLGEGIAESVINSLSTLPDLRVVPRNTAFSHAGRESETEELAEELGVRAVVTGRVTRRGDQLVVSAELVDTSNNAQLWGARYDSAADDILAIETDISQQIADALRLKLSGDDSASDTRQATANPQARMAYMEARYWWAKRTRDGFERALELFDRAIEDDPSYAMAYVGKAETYSMRAFYIDRPAEMYPLIQENAETAIRINPELADAYPVLALSMAFYNPDYDFEQGERLFQKALELNPRNPIAHHWYGNLLNVQGEFDAAGRRFEQAHELDPESNIIRHDMALLSFWMGDDATAERRLRQEIAVNPSFYRYHESLARVLAHQGRHDEALASMRTALDLAGEVPYIEGDLGLLLALAGRHDEARTELERLEHAANRRYVPPVPIGAIHAALGDFDRAFEWLDKGVEANDSHITFADRYPLFEFIREDPRWQSIRERVGLD